MSAAVLPFDRPARYILVWPGDEPISPQFNGQVVTIPPRDATAEAEKGIYRFGSAKDAIGKLIPGTIILQDTFTTDPASPGEVLREFDARQWVSGLHQNNKPLFKRGLRVVTEPEEVPAAMAEGYPAWREAQIAAWEEEVRTELKQRKDAEAQGRVRQPLSAAAEASLKRAIAGLMQDQERRKAAIPDTDLLNALGQPAPTTAAAPNRDAALLGALMAQGGTPTVPVAAPVVAPPTGDHDIGIVAAELYRLAKANSVKLTKDELDGLLSKDQDVMIAVQGKLEESGVEV